MYTCTRTITRPSTSIKWYFEPGVLPGQAAMTAHRLATYIDTGKCISSSYTISPDGLVYYYTGVWVDKAAYDESDADSVFILYWAARDAYCAAHNIVLGPVVLTQS